MACESRSLACCGVRSMDQTPILLGFWRKKAETYQIPCLFLSISMLSKTIRERVVQLSANFPGTKTGASPRLWVPNVRRAKTSRTIWPRCPRSAKKRSAGCGLMFEVGVRCKLAAPRFNPTTLPPTNIAAVAGYVEEGFPLENTLCQLPC